MPELLLKEHLRLHDEAGKYAVFLGAKRLTRWTANVEMGYRQYDRWERKILRQRAGDLGYKLSRKGYAWFVYENGRFTDHNEPFSGKPGYRHSLTTDELDKILTQELDEADAERLHALRLIDSVSTN